METDVQDLPHMVGGAGDVQLAKVGEVVEPNKKAAGFAHCPRNRRQKSKKFDRIRKT